ncbi:MAG: DUF460 domain-containing protein [Candidatus Nanohaloarchaea archaeon]
MSEALVVGIDPGSTSAVAALNLDREMKLLESRREFPPHEMIELLIAEGKPVLVGSDTSRMASTAEKVASSVGARKFSPEEDLSGERKDSIGFGSNSHEKDAAAAAVHAFNKHRRSIEKINRESRNSDQPRKEIARKRFRDGIRTKKI